MSFQESVKLLHNIGTSPSPAHHIRANYNTREEVASAPGLLTFDGVYKNVYHNRDLLKGRRVILFVTGDYIGGDNTFDMGMPREEFTTYKQLMELYDMGCEIGWHSWSHRDLTHLSDEEIIRELTPPEYIPMKYFAYPYGRYNDKVLHYVQKMYKKAFSVFNTDGTKYTIQRSYI